MGTADASRVLTLDVVQNGSIQPGNSATFATPVLHGGDLYSVNISLDAPASLTDADELQPRTIASPITFNVVKDQIYTQPARLHVEFASAGNAAIAKDLHSGDPGTYFIVKAAASAPAQLTFTAPARPEEAIGYRVEFRRVADAQHAFGIVPNTARDWQHATPIVLGKSVFGGSDDIEYLYNIKEGKVGWQWLTFEYTGTKPQLAFFELDLLDRDVPCNLKVFRQEDGPDGRRLVEYKNGSDPTEIRHDDQADELVGFKFLSRVLTPGRYYVSVKSNHPDWSLRTTLYDVPPYSDPHKAVEVAMRYMMDIGDSFFSNTPRKGAVRTRAENVTDETERCITCHPAHFTTLSTLTAVRNGYTVHNHPEFKFMMDKLYNAPAPFYGFDKTYWLRWDLAPANSISRLGTMLLMYEDLVSRRSTETPDHTARYLRLAYDARDRLPRADMVHMMGQFEPTKSRNFEFDGNRPISDFRVATDSWYVLQQLSKRGEAAEFQNSADHLRRLMTSAPTNDLEDIVEQTKGMVAMGDPEFRPIIQQNIQKILARQHDDGGWVTAEYMSNEQFFDAAARAPFEKKSDPSLQFMTGEALYALKVAGFDMSDARVKKAEQWLLHSQREFGGWLDNKGELFLMPHLETSWAVMGLSQMYPESGPAVAPAAPASSDSALADTLNWLDQVWYDRDPSALARVLPLLSAPEPLLRAQAAAAIGRMGVDAPDPTPFRTAVAPLVGLLGDRTKIVSRAAAWSLRQLGNDGIGVDDVKQALDSPDEYVRRGAARVFYQYWYHMVDREDIARAFIRHVNDPDMLVRIESLKTLWRWWYRTPDFTLRREIERAFLDDAQRAHEHPLVRLNVAQALYNILDENTVQFHKNWLRTIPLQKDRDRAEAARIAQVERPLAGELAAVLKGNGSAQTAAGDVDTGRMTVLTALDYYFLRGGIGNDYDSITFYDRSGAETMSEALLPLTEVADARISSKALEALAVAREARNRDLVLAVLKHLNSPDKHLRDVAQQELSRLPVDYSAQSSQKAEHGVGRGASR